jgi:ABC-type bacteriocin/lantibiotic exporter with double-glycine peptidase domain
MHELTTDEVAALSVDRAASPVDPGRGADFDPITGLDEAIALLAAAADVAIDPGRARGSARDAVARGVGLLDALRGVCEDVALRPAVFSRTPRDVVSASADSALPLVCEGPLGLVMVRLRADRRYVGRRLGTGAHDAPLDAATLAAMTGLPSPDAATRWLVATPAAPLQSIATPGGSDHHDHHEHPSAFERVRALLSLERDDLWVVLVYAVAVGLLSLVTPITVQALVNSVAFGALLQPIVVLTVIVFTVLGFAAFLRALQVRVVEAIQRRIFVRVALDVAHRLPRVDVTALDGRYGPELVNRFFDVLTVQKSAAIFLLDGLALVLQAGIGLLVLAFYHPALLALDVVLLLAAAFVVVYLGRGGPETSIDESKAKYAVAAWLEEVARHPHTFRSDAGTAFATEQADLLARRYLAARRAHFRLVYRQVVGSLWLQVAASAAVLGIGGALVIGRELTLGQLVAAEFIVTAVVASLAKLGKHLETWYDLLAAADKLGHLADLPLEARGDSANFDQTPRGAAVVLRGVGFHHGHGAAVLHGVDLTLQPGARAVVTGESGAGKSTLAALLFGMYLPSEGSITVDGADTREAAPGALRERVALVGHIPEVLEATIFENVTAGRHGVTRREVWAALAAVGLDARVRALPSGLDTALSTAGAPLSHGALQRLMVARAIAARPRLLVIDGALDGLDSEAREAVEAALFDPAASWTLLVLASPGDAVTRHAQRVLALPSPRGHHAPEVTR